MTATMTTKSRPLQRTWVDWAGPSAPDPPELLSREEMVSRLVADGVNVTAGDLVFWQTKGIMPYPIKRRRHGLTQAFYAPWVGQLVRELRRLQDEGRKLQDIRPTLQSIAEALAHNRPIPTIIQVPTATATGHAMTPSVFHSLATAFAQVYQDRFGTPIERVEVRLFDDRGNPLSFEFAMAQDNNVTEQH